ncbi:MAG: hypothetical protein IAG10_23295 [Planctomycetaceae bacterium]|nr:hypothetical protein [Planctomycetaceae bacterium]
MKRYFFLALITGLICGSSLIADDAVFREIVIQNRFATDYCPTVPAQMQCETPVLSYPAPQTVRRVVPRTTYQNVAKTIMVPTTVMETRQTQSVEYREETRERAVTVYEQVPETRLVTTEQTVLVPATRHRTETYAVQVPVERLVQENYTVDKVCTETRTRKQTVSRCVPSAAVRTVISGAEVTKRGIKSDLGGVRVHSSVVGGIRSQEAVTVMRPQLVEQTIAYDVQVTRPETHTRMVKQLDYRTETRTRSVPETVQVAKVQTQTHKVTEVRSVPRQKTETYVVQVPHVVANQVQVPVTKMVAQQITEQVPVTTYDVIEEPVSNCYSCDR